MDAGCTHPKESAAEVGEAISVTLSRRWLVVSLGAPHRVASAAIVGGGLREAERVVWHEVTDAELEPPVDPEALFARRLAERGLVGAVGLLTGRRLDRFVDSTARDEGLEVRCVATVGLSNALRAGDPPCQPRARVGTINLLAIASAPLTEEALLEATALCAEARTVAVYDAGYPSRVSGRPASGTGTDCIVVAAPLRGPCERYAGKHTRLGFLLGDAVYRAVARGVAEWLEEYGR